MKRLPGRIGLGAIGLALACAVLASACSQPAAAPAAAPTSAPAAPTTAPAAAPTTAPAAAPTTAAAPTAESGASATAAPAATSGAAAGATPEVAPTVGGQALSAGQATILPAPLTPAPNAKKQRSDIKTAFVGGAVDNPYWTTMKEAALAEGKKLGVQVLYQGTKSEGDIPGQTAIVEDMLTQKVDVLVFAPAGPKELIPTIEAANNAGIPVICVDRGADGGKIATTIATDNLEGAQLGAEYLGKYLKQQGKGTKVAILEGIQAIANGRDRKKGAENGFQNTGMNLVASQPGEWVQDKGAAATENIVTANPDLAGIFASNDQMGLGAIQALKSAGKLDQVKVVGYDAIPQALQAVKDGTMLATVKQFPERMGELGVDYAVRAAEGETDFPGFINSGVVVVDKSNVDQYMTSQ